MKASLFSNVLFLLAVSLLPMRATQDPPPPLEIPFRPTPDLPDLDRLPAPAAAVAETPTGPQPISGPIAPAGGQPAGALSGRIVFTSAGHGWDWTGSAWALGRPLLLEMNEDYGNLDQMTMFAIYCFNAGATVVPLRPIGFQTNEVVLDNVSAGVTWSGSWSDSSSSIYYGQAGALPYRFANVSATETATATYTPNIPVAGFYPVYTWVLAGGNRINQLYRINHTGGQSLVRVPHQMVGNGWVYLGTYYFNAGGNSAKGAVIVSNLGEGASPSGVVIADAIRFGNGMGDVDRGGGSSGYPREEEAARYWIQRSLGQGQDSGIYANGNVTAPPRMAVEMNRQAEGNMFKRVYIGFHSNAGGGRGVLGLYNNASLFPGTATSNQFRLAQLTGAEINNDLTGIPVPPLELAWYNRGSSVTYARSDYAFGEINNTIINNEFDATIIEVAFHDDASDAKLLRDPKVRNWVARASYQAVLRFMNEFDAAPLTFLPEPPVNVRAIAAADGVRVSWSSPITQGGSGSPTGYVVYQSTDGYGFGNPIAVSGGGTVSLLVTNLDVDTDYYFRVAAVNAGGESLPSETVGCRRAANPLSSRILFVNGFTRFDRTLNLRQSPYAQQYQPPGHDHNSGVIDRVMPRRANAFDYVVDHGKAIRASSAMGFDSCQVQAATNGLVPLTDYSIVIWACGNQSTADRTFNPPAQARVSAFLAAGGHLFVTGSEIAWDLDRASGPSAADRDFLRNRFHAALVNNTNDDAGIYTVNAVAGSLFAGNVSMLFDDGSRGIYCVGYPDAITPVGPGAAAALSYPGYSGGAAGIVYDGSAGGGKVVYWGFPFETVTTSSARNAYLADILKLFSRPPRFEAADLAPDLRPVLLLSGEPGLTYRIETSTNFGNWSFLTNVVNTTGLAEVTDAPATSAQRYYRARVVF